MPLQCAILDSHQLLDWAAARVPASNQRWRQQNLELAFGPTACQLLLAFCPTSDALSSCIGTAESQLGLSPLLDAAEMSQARTDLVASLPL